MAGISISELISKDDTTNVADGFIPISINNNTFKIKAGTFLNDTNNCINTFVTKVQEQSATIQQCITNTNTLCASIECNNTTINSVIGNTQNIYNCVTELSGCIAAASSITDLNVVANDITNLESSVENIRTRFTVLSSFTDNVNNEVLARGSATAVDNLINRVNALDSCVANEATCIVSLSGQICALDVAGNACSFNGLEQRILKNETFIANDAVKKCVLDGCISEIDGKLDAKASVESRDSILSRLTTTEGVATGAAGDVVTINNCISEIDGKVNAKANATQVNALVASVETAQSDATAANNSIVGLQTQITNLDVGSQAQKIDQLTTSISNADTAITNLQSKDQSIDSCISCIDGCIVSTNSDVSTMQTKVNGSGTGSIQATCTIAVAGCNLATTINAKYGVRLNTCGIVSGFCLNSGGGTSDFKIQANCFILADQTNSNCGSPFSVISNCVRMCGACIKDLSVDTLQIGEQAITSSATIAASDFQMAINARTNPHCVYPKGTGFTDIASGTIVSVGCPTVVNFGFNGTCIKTQSVAGLGGIGDGTIKNITAVIGMARTYWSNYTTPLFTTAGGRRLPHGGVNRLSFSSSAYNYCIETRLVRTGGAGTKCFEIGSTSQFIDENPGTGAVTYKLQGRFKRALPKFISARTCYRYKIKHNSKTSKTSDNHIRFCELMKKKRTPSLGKYCRFYPDANDFVPNQTQSIKFTNPFIEIRQSKR